MNLDYWAAIGVVCGALIALGTVVTWAYRRVVRPMWKHTVKSLRRLNRGMDDLLGSPAEYDDDGHQISAAVTSLRSEIISIKGHLTDLAGELDAVKRDLATHVQWHPAPAGRPASGQQPPRRNGKTGDNPRQRMGHENDEW